MNNVQPIRDKKKIEEMKNVCKNMDYKYYILFSMGINVGFRVSDVLELKVSDVRNNTHITIVEDKTGKSKKFFINETLKDLLEPYIKPMSDDMYLFESQKINKNPMTKKQYETIVLKGHNTFNRDTKKMKTNVIDCIKKQKFGKPTALLFEILELETFSFEELIHLTVAELNQINLCEGLRKKINEYTKDMMESEKVFKRRKGMRQPFERVQAYKKLNEAARACDLIEIGTHSLRKTFGYWYYQKYKDVAILQELFNHSSPSITLKYIGINQDMLDSTIMEFSL